MSNEDREATDFYSLGHVQFELPSKVALSREGCDRTNSVFGKLVCRIIDNVQKICRMSGCLHDMRSSKGPFDRQGERVA